MTRRSVTVSGDAVGSVTVYGDVVGSISDGLLVLLGVTHTDDAALWPLPWPARSGSCASWTTRSRPATFVHRCLVVSQFTLYADARKGRRPSWSAAAPAEVAEPLVTAFADALRSRGAHVETGRFRAHMLVESVNVGPRTVLLEL